MSAAAASPRELLATDFVDSPALAEVAGLLRSSRKIWDCVTQSRLIPRREARYAPPPASLAPAVVEALKKRGVDRLYSHQAQAVEASLAGKNVVVVTPTASGKSVCYAAPLLQELLADPEARALCLFPTKALSRDQLDNLRGMAGALERDIKIHTYDGDTPGPARRSVRNAGHVVVTNPDMLHGAILPHHSQWPRLFENLKLIVIDEVHAYRGVFGSNLANVLRRLRRIAEFHGSKPRFICLSATIANPKELCEELTGAPFELIDDNGAPQAEKAVFFYNPPVVNEELGIRASLLEETRRVAMRFVGAGLQTIVFGRTRSQVEVLTTYIKRDLERLGRDPGLCRGYRGGYLPNERREIEREVKEGRVMCVVSTNALEMGIDIGRLRVAVLAGYPGSIASTWQQGGRAGRSDEASAMVLVAGSAPIDQFIVKNPEYFFGASPELGIVNPDNVSIYSSHVQCAAFELPFEEGDRFGGHDPAPVLEFLERQGMTRKAGGRWHWCAETYPSASISLRRADPENFIVQDMSRRNEAIAEIDYFSAPYFIHDNAIYIHDAKTYHVEKLDWEKRIALVRPIETDFYTDAVAKTTIRALEVENEIAAPSFDASDLGPDGLPPAPWPFAFKRLGDIAVQTVVAKYKKIRFETLESIGFGEVHVPEMEMHTEAYWIALADDFAERAKIAGMDPAGGLSGVARALGNVIPAIAMCDSRDVQCVSMTRSPGDDRPAIYVYDRFPGGVGLARRLFSRDRAALEAAMRVVERCGCGEAGCPSCVGAPLELGPGGKATARWMLRRLAGWR